MASGPGRTGEGGTGGKGRRGWYWWSGQERVVLVVRAGDAGR